MPVASIETKISSITNSDKEPIDGAQLYKHGSDEEHKTFIPDFITATIAIDEHEKPIKISNEKEKNYHLYSGNCSCDN